MPEERSRHRISRRESLSFLNQAGQALAESLDYEATLQRVVQLAVPRVACYCAVDMLEEGAVRRVAMAHVDPDAEVILRRTADYPHEQRAGMPLGEVMRTREPVLIPSITDELLRRVARTPEHLDLLRLLAPTSFIMSPLIARGRLLGVLSLGSTRTDRFYGEGDVLITTELARTAAFAIDNARLYRDAADAVRARDDVLRVVSHDLRNPIGAVSMSAEFLLEEGPAEIREGAFGRTLRTIRSAAERANRMIDDLLDVTRIETGRLPLEPAPEAVASLLEEAVDLHRPLAHEKGIALDCSAAPSLPPVHADRARVLQVLGNLLGNALKFTPAGGSVVARAELQEDQVRFSVEDSGPGIPAEQIPHLFDRFWQASRTDRRGLGLGLAIVRGIVDAHGGRVWVESEPGAGAVFHFTLPLHASATARGDG